ncbi:MAG: hypothetical protein CMI27_01340 [Opitutae bacterium]|nr:hypothetical protein [Opitutae bacterium]
MRSAVRICHLPPLFDLKNMGSKKTKVEWFIIIGLATLFGVVWLYAHWNLSRQPPHHKGPGSVGYEEPPSPPSASDNLGDGK